MYGRQASRLHFHVARLKLCHLTILRIPFAPHKLGMGSPASVSVGFTVHNDRHTTDTRQTLDRHYD